MAQFNTGRISGFKKAQSFKKRSSAGDTTDSNGNNNNKKGYSVKFTRTHAAEEPSPQTRPWASMAKKSQSTHNSPNMSSVNTRSLGMAARIARFDKSKSVNNMADEDSSDDDIPNLNLNLTKHRLHNNKNGKNNKSSPHQRHSSHYAHKDYKAKYEKKAEQNRQLNRTISDQQFTINNLKKELKKYTKTDYYEYDIPTQEKNYERTIKHKEKEIANLRRRLKLAINDYEKVYQYYKKQLDLFKKNQQKWLDQQKSNNKDVTKYVFADDIRKIKIRKKGVRIYFGDGEDVIFDNIEILRGKDYNDDDQYRTLVKKVREQKEEKTDHNGYGNNNQQHKPQLVTDLDEDDMIILCLNELRSRITDVIHRQDEGYGNKIQERYDKLPIYHIDHDYLTKLKTNNERWIKLFRKSGDDRFGKKAPQTIMKNGALKRKGKFGAFFSAQKEMKQGKQPTICVQNNVILNNINNHKKPKNISYSKHLQKRIDKAMEATKQFDTESKNIEGDEDLNALKDVSVLNGWFTAQIEMQRFNQQPSVCIKNNINLDKLQKAKSKFKLKKKLRAKTIQRRLDENIKENSKKNQKNNKNKRGNNNNIAGHGKLIPMDKGDSSEEDENGNDIYNKGNVLIGDTQKITGFSNIMNGWFTAQLDIQESKQPTICVQNNVILNNIATTKEIIDINDPKKNKNKNKKWGRNNNKNNKQKRRIFTNAKSLQKKLNMNTSNGLSKNALDLSDDSEDEDLYDVMDEKKQNNKNDDKIHENVWYYKNKQRTKFIKSLKIFTEKGKLLKQIGTYLNRILPTSIDYSVIKHYMPIFNNVYDIICACFDGVLLSVLLNFIDDDLIDLRALHLPENKYPISRDQVIENLYVVKLCIASLDLHEFPDFGVDFDPKTDDKENFCWYNPIHTIDIMLLIMMHAYMGMMNKKINIFKYPELFRLCQKRDEKKTAQKTSAKEWLNRWIIFIRKPVIKRHGRNLSKSTAQDLFSSIDLGGYHSPASSVNISWDQIKIEPDDDDSKSTAHDFRYVWDTDRDFSGDIVKIENKLNVKIYQVKTIANQHDINDSKNYLLQLLYISDLFLYDNKIEKLTGSEQKQVTDYLKKRPRDDDSIIAWVNSFKIMDENYEFQYVDNLGDDISDGVIILSILDQCKPGCVDWKGKGIRASSDIRHKFDKLTNCNVLKQICDSEFNDIFHLVGMGGNDIVDQNPKYIRSLLLQIQRYHSTKLMAKILFKKKAVTDDELLTWMNNRLKVYKQMVAAMNKMHNNDVFMANNNVKMKKNVIITSFDDKNGLSDCLNFCNVVSSINPKWINYANILNEQECKSQSQKKVLNAKYLITVMRRLGCDNLFITPKELCDTEHRAVLAMSTAIMTTAARYNEYDQLALFAKNLKQIRTKLQKKS